MTVSKATLFSLVALLVPIAIFFTPVFFQNKLPIPADTIPGLYHPMRDALTGEYPNGPPFKNFLITDAVRQQYPWREFSINQLKQGQLPLWNPHNFSGTPHLANFQSAAFYPLNLIFWFTDFTSGWSILVISQQVLGAIFLFFYLRNLKLHHLAAVFGTLVWIFSGHYIAWLEWNTAVHVALWSPLILLSFDRLLYRNNPGIKHPGIEIMWQAILLFALAAQFFAGYPQPWFYLSLLQFTYFIWRFSQNRNMKTLVKIGVIYLLFFLLISSQLSATYQFSQLSNRVGDQGNLLEKPDWFLPHQNLIQLIVPDFFGNPATLNYWGIFNYTEFVSFIGIIPFIFILSFWLSKKKSGPVWFFTLFVFLALLFATKNPVSTLQFKLDLPFIGSSQPSRWIVVIDLALAILAAISFNNFISSKKANLFKPLALTLLVISILWLFTLNPELFPFSASQSDLRVSRRNLILPTLELASAALVFAALFLISKSKLKLPIKPKHLVAGALIMVTAFSGIRFARKFTPFSNPQFLYPESKILTYLQDNAGLYRYMTTDRRILAPNINLAYGLYTIEGYDPLYLEDYGKLITSIDSSSIPAQSKPFNRIITTNNHSSPVIDLLGVKYILSLANLFDTNFELIMQEGETKLYQNNNVLPRAFITQDTDMFSIKDPQPASITSYKPTQITIAVTNSPGGLLVLSDSFHPNWTAILDGQPVEIINYSGLRATMVPEGNHEIVHRYSKL